LLEKLGDELRFVFITSYARIHPISKKNDACVEAVSKMTSFADLVIL
jgi:isoleucyl-tRNA synthetase